MKQQLQVQNVPQRIQSRQVRKTNVTALKPTIDLEQLIISEKIAVKDNDTALNTQSVIWPWHFPSMLKNELATKGLIIRLKPRDVMNNYDIRQMQVAFLLKGSLKLETSIPVLKHNVLDLYFSGETLSLSQNDTDGLSPRLTSFTDSFIYALPTKHFYAMAKYFPELFEFSSYLKDISLIRTQRRQLILGNFTAERKVAWFLVNASKKLKMPLRRSFELHFPMSRIEISDFLNMSPETLCRGLQSLDRKGIIHTKKNKITVLDFSALAAR